MTDAVLPVLNPEMSAYLARERDRLAESLRPANKAALFDALAAAGITSVLVAFDGCGDSGQIESVDAQAGETAVELPGVDVEFASLTWEGAVERTSMSVRDAVEALAYECLERTHGGWEDNEGAYGEFTFDVASRSITLDYNERYVDVRSDLHEF